MLELLTQYLTRTRSVSIPNLGSLTLERVPATWSVSDRELAGPGFRVQAGAEAPVDGRQIAFLAGALQESEGVLRERLSEFGSRLQRQLLRGPFLWPGVGLLHWQEGRLTLDSSTPVMSPQAAARVIHADARHSIRVGEQELWSDAEQTEAATATRRHELEWLGWLLVVLAALFVLWCFYQANFSVHGTGLQTGIHSTLP